MKKSLLAHVFVISFTLLVFSAVSVAEKQAGTGALVSPTGNEVSGNQWLFIIGIDSYNNNMPRLNTSVKDGKAIREILMKRYYFDEYHVIELYNDEATRRNILGKLRYLTRRVGPEDSVILFYSGHGGLDSGNREGGWIPVDGSPEDMSTWISNKDIYDYLKIDSIQAKHVLIIVDSIFSGDSFRSYKGKMARVTDEVIKQAYQKRSRQVITSGDIKPLVKDVNDSSIFTHFLIKGLEENKKPFLIPSDLFKGIKAGVEKNNSQKPRLGTLRNKGGQKEGELVFFINSDELEHLKEVKLRDRATRKKLRSSFMDLSVAQIQSMPNIEIREEQEWGFYGHSTIRHKYEAKTIVYDEVVIDHTTGLMWHQNGSERFKDKEKIAGWINNLNQKGYAGYNDWRLPTAEEAVSLLERKQQFGDMYVDPIFDKKQPWIWTGDSYGDAAAWAISACYGSVFWSKFNKYYCIRPVRTMK